jgi:hypothetical protein
MYSRFTHVYAESSVLHGSTLTDIVEYNPGIFQTHNCSRPFPDISVATKIVKRSTLLQVEENLKRFPHCLLLTRVGQFYEVLHL